MKIRQRMTIMVLAFIIGVFVLPPISLPHQTTIQAQKQARLPALSDQQIGLLVGLEVKPSWLRTQVESQCLIYGVVKPSDKVPAGVAGYSFLTSSDKDAGTYLFLKRPRTG